MSSIRRTIKVRELVNAEGNVVTATLKWTNSPYSAEAGRSWYLVIDGNTYYPDKTEGITSDDLAKNWAGIKVRALGYRFK